MANAMAGGFRVPGKQSLHPVQVVRVNKNAWQMGKNSPSADMNLLGH
jgi:hypothetical protein